MNGDNMGNGAKVEEGGELKACPIEKCGCSEPYQVWREVENCPNRTHPENREPGHDVNEGLGGKCSICHEAIPKPHHYHVSCVSKLQQEIGRLQAENREPVGEINLRGICSILNCSDGGDKQYPSCELCDPQRPSMCPKRPTVRRTLQAKPQVGGELMKAVESFCAFAGKDAPNKITRNSEWFHELVKHAVKLKAAFQTSDEYRLVSAKESRVGGELLEILQKMESLIAFEDYYELEMFYTLMPPPKPKRNREERMVEHVKEYWTCDRYPWGCHLHHTSKESAEDCCCGDGPMEWDATHQAQEGEG